MGVRGTMGTALDRAVFVLDIGAQRRSPRSSFALMIPIVIGLVVSWVLHRVPNI